MSNNVISNTTVIQTQTAYNNPYSGGLSGSIAYKTTGDFIFENNYKFLNIILVGSVTFIMLANFQPALVVYSQ